MDTSAPIRQPSDLRDLADAVRGAGPEDESHWIEWKGSLDLTRPAGRFAIARAILGFGNRRHDRAATVAGGFAYLLVGVAPGDVQGIDAVDPADLDQSLRPYIGDHAPGWMPQYVTLDGKQVLVVVVDPPRWGDPVHTLRRAFDATEAGTIFVRGNGRTDRAGPGEIDYLVSRACARQSGLSLSVATDPSTLRAPNVPDIEAAVDAWLKREAESLLAPLDAQDAVRGFSPPPAGPRQRILNLDELKSDDDGESMTIAEFEDIERRIGAGEAVTADERAAYEKERRSLSEALGPMFQRIAQAGLSAVSSPEDRTPEKYRQQVAKYLNDAREALFEEFARAYVNNGYGRLAIALTNQTDRNFTGVELVVEFPGAISAVDPEDIDDGMPERPRLFGTRKPYLDPMTGLNWAHVSPVRSFPGPAVPRVRIDHTGSVALTFPATDLRPHETDDLFDVVYLLVSEPAGSVVTGSWRATATNSDGMVSGELLVEVTDTLDVLSLLPTQSD